MSIKRSEFHDIWFLPDINRFILIIKRFNLGLDPALPLFVTTNLDEKLDKTDAIFVDVLHTNALEKGKLEDCGHADFFANSGIVQPGCTLSGKNGEYF